MDRNRVTRVIFPSSMYHDMRTVKREIFGDGGLHAEIRAIKRKQEATFWVALGTFATMIAGVGSLIVGAFHMHF